MLALFFSQIYACKILHALAVRCNKCAKQLEEIEELEELKEATCDLEDGSATAAMKHVLRLRSSLMEERSYSALLLGSYETCPLPYDGPVRVHDSNTSSESFCADRDRAPSSA